MSQPRNTLRHRRERLGLSQAALANRVGVTERAVRQWEKGERVPQLGNRVPLGEALGLDLDELQVLLAEFEADYVARLAETVTPSTPGDGPRTPKGGPR